VLCLLIPNYLIVSLSYHQQRDSRQPLKKNFLCLLTDCSTCIIMSTTRLATASSCFQGVGVGAGVYGNYKENK